MYIFFTFFLLFLGISKFNFLKSFKDLILSTVLFFSCFIVITTEILSLLNSLNIVSLVTVWGIFSLILIVILVLHKDKTLFVIRRFKAGFLIRLNNLRFYEKTFFSIIITFLLFLFYQGIAYPPNNFDSMTYHMSRIMFWISNESVEHFPTNVLRDLYQPPFIEYIILHVNLLDGNDYFSNTIQWIFLVFSIIAIWSILDYFFVSRFYKLLAAFLLITIPAVELQSSTPKNDIVCGFFTLTIIYFCIKTYYELNYKNFILLGVSIGLGILTKGTIFIFIAPILLLFGIFILIKLIKTKDFKIILKGIGLIFIILAINAGHFSRNYRVGENILVFDKAEGQVYNNAKMNKDLLISNLLKNIGLHVGYPMQEDFDFWIKEYHYDHEISIDNEDTNFLEYPYQGPNEFETHEDLAPNDKHLLLLGIFSVLSLILSVFNPKKYVKELLLVFIIVFQILFFVGYLRWQPTHTRLHIPIFMISILLIISTLKQFKWLLIIILAFLPSLTYSFYFNYVYNNSRPIITNPEYTKEIRLTDNRFKKYFSNYPSASEEYFNVYKMMNEKKLNKIGFMFYDWKYPLLHNFYRKEIKLVNINVTNISSKISQNNQHIDIIVSNLVNQKEIVFEGKTYINRTPKNTTVWLYK